MHNTKLETVFTSKGTASHFYKDGKHYYIASYYIMTVDIKSKVALIESIKQTSKIIKHIQDIARIKFYIIPGYKEYLNFYNSWNTDKIEITSFFEHHLLEVNVSREILKELLETYHSNF